MTIGKTISFRLKRHEKRKTIDNFHMQGDG
jgi:hypothetical protein